MNSLLIKSEYCYLKLDIPVLPVTYVGGVLESLGALFEEITGEALILHGISDGSMLAKFRSRIGLPVISFFSFIGDIFARWSKSEKIKEAIDQNLDVLIKKKIAEHYHLEADTARIQAETRKTLAEAKLIESQLEESPKIKDNVYISTMSNIKTITLALDLARASVQLADTCKTTTGDESLTTTEAERIIQRSLKFVEEALGTAAREKVSEANNDPRFNDPEFVVSLFQFGMIQTLGQEEELKPFEYGEGK